MAARSGILRRYGLALLLTALTAWLAIDSTLPAARDRDRVRAARIAQEREASDVLRQAEIMEAWALGLEDDPQLRRRMAELHSFSPEVVGPLVAPPDGAAPVDQPGGR